MFLISGFLFHSLSFCFSVYMINLFLHILQVFYYYPEYISYCCFKFWVWLFWYFCKYLCWGGFFSQDSALGSLDFPSQPACFSTLGGSSLLCDLVLGESKNSGWFSVCSTSLLLWGLQWQLSSSSFTRLGMESPYNYIFYYKVNSYPFY